MLCGIICRLINLTGGKFNASYREICFFAYGRVVKATLPPFSYKTLMVANQTLRYNKNICPPDIASFEKSSYRPIARLFCFYLLDRCN